MEYFKSVAKIDIQHVPYKGTGPMLSDLLGGQIEMTFNGIPPIAGQLKAGKIKPIAVGAATRVPAFADLPTIAELIVKEQARWGAVVRNAGIKAE